MTNQPKAITGAYAGLMAAGNAIVSKYAKRRLPNYSRIPAGFAPPTTQAMGRILQPTNGKEDIEQRLARVTACAIFHSLEKGEEGKPYELKAEGHAMRLASTKELEQLNDRSKTAKKSFAKALAPKPKAAAKSKAKANPSTKAKAKAKAVEDIASARAFNDEESVCHYCAIFQEFLHPDHPAPIEVLNHSARINSDFDPETNISEASITEFQLFVPEDLAKRALDQSHPLLWEKTAEAIFEFSRPAVRCPNERPFVEWQPVKEAEVEIDLWSKAAFEGDPAAAGATASSGTEPVGYLYERAKHPWNEQISAVIENVIRITEFAHISVDAATVTGINASDPTAAGDGILEKKVRQVVKTAKKQEAPAGGLVDGRRREAAHIKSRLLRVGAKQKLDPQQASILSYGYQLETCIKSDFGLGIRNGGLDIDDGRFDGSAIHYEKITKALVDHLERRDFMHLVHGLVRRYPRDATVWQGLVDLVAGLPTDPLATIPPETKRTIVNEIAEALKKLWNGKDPWLLTISASKRLRYSYPRDGQTDLWYLLTWMAPALLFTFINRSVCQLPHLLQLDFFKPEKQSKK